MLAASGRNLVADQVQKRHSAGRKEHDLAAAVSGGRPFVPLDTIAAAARALASEAQRVGNLDHQSYVDVLAVRRKYVG